MALSRIVVFGDGSTKQWAIPFALGYMKEADITCRVGAEVDGTGDPVYRPLTFLSPEWVEVGGTVPANLERVTFTRTVDREELIVNYSDGDVMNEANLDTAQRQAIMLVHEVLDGRFETFQSNFDLGGFKVTNLGAPTVSTDGANKAYVDAQISTGAANAAAAAASALAAASSAGTAASSASSAVAASTASVTARDQSVSAKDTAVAAVASTAGSASAAATSASNAANSATAAANSATASAGSASTASTANSNAQTAKTAAETAATTAGTARDQSVAAKDLAVAANSTAQTAATTATTKATAASASAAAALVSENNVATASVPVGMVFFSPKGTVPAGYLALEGASFDQTVYPALYSYLGVAVLPDYRDRVLRGAGTLAGAVFTTQEDAFQDHQHMSSYVLNGSVLQSDNSSYDVFSESGAVRTDARTGYVLQSVGTKTLGSETRVKAAIGKFVIKAYSALVNSGTADLVAIEAAQQYMVRFDAQTLSQAQKGQVLQNIGSAWERIGDIVSLSSDVAAIDWTGLGAYRSLRLTGRGLPASDNQNVALRFGVGGVFDASAIYNTLGTHVTSANAPSWAWLPSASRIYVTINGTGNADVTRGADISLTVSSLNQAKRTKVMGTFGGTLAAGQVAQGTIYGEHSVASAQDSLRIISADATGMKAGSYFVLEGLRA